MCVPRFPMPTALHEISGDGRRAQAWKVTRGVHRHARLVFQSTTLARGGGSEHEHMYVCTYETAVIACSTNFSHLSHIQI